MADASVCEQDLLRLVAHPRPGLAGQRERSHALARLFRGCGHPHRVVPAVWVSDDGADAGAIVLAKVFGASASARGTAGDTATELALTPMRTRATPLPEG
jgi:hypothetical protein